MIVIDVYSLFSCSLHRVGIRVVEYVTQSRDDKQTCLMCLHLTLKELAAIVTLKVKQTKYVFFISILAVIVKSEVYTIKMVLMIVNANTVEFQ